MTRALRPVLFGAVLALVAAACGGGDGGAADADRQSIDVWIMEPGSAELKDFFAATTADFEAANPGADVEVQFVPWANAHDQFFTAIGGGTTPDVAEMGSTWTPEFGAIGALAPAEADLTGYVDSLVEGATVDGVIYGIPWYAGARALIYRTDVLDALGLAVPTTWEELVAAGRAIRDGEDLGGDDDVEFAFGVAGNANHYVLPLVWQNGGEIAVQEGGEWRSAMDSPEAIEAVGFYAGLYSEERFSPEGALSWNVRDVRAAFEAGDLAMMIGGGWDLRAILDAHPELEGKVGTALLPAGPSGSRDTFAGGSHLVVFEGSQRQDLARRYVEFLLDPQRVATFADSIGFLPGATDGLATLPTAGDDLYATFTDQLTEHSRTYPPSPAWGGFEADGLFTNAVQEVMAGKRSAAEAMAGVAAAMNDAFGG